MRTRQRLPAIVLALVLVAALSGCLNFRTGEVYKNTPYRPAELTDYLGTYRSDAAAYDTEPTRASVNDVFYTDWPGPTFAVALGEDGSLRLGPPNHVALPQAAPTNRRVYAANEFLVKDDHIELRPPRGFNDSPFIGVHKHRRNLRLTPGGDLVIEVLDSGAGTGMLILWGAWNVKHASVFERLSPAPAAPTSQAQTPPLD